ncbi:hypothetical protein SAMN04488123_11349 [Natribacillus halophilus]|uniref:Uncharacterized protein n=1 Tax=Natribacillus halophilus TaxID=549003 RepID=A0A1G8QQ49_9BACI|nr:hypothetical protein SAMN04488123_11349 [Natribacillus halophilus]
MTHDVAVADSFAPPTDTTVRDRVYATIRDFDGRSFVQFARELIQGILPLEVADHLTQFLRDRKYMTLTYLWKFIVNQRTCTK